MESEEPLEGETSKSLVYENYWDLIGNTPLIDIRRIPKCKSLNCKMYVKAEFLNPSGTIKDRIALGLFNQLEKSTATESIKKNDETKVETQDNKTGAIMLITAPDNELSMSIANLANVKGKYQTLTIVPPYINPLLKNHLKFLEARIKILPSSSSSNPTPDASYLKLASLTAEKYAQKTKGSVNICKNIGCPEVMEQIAKISQEILNSGVIPDLFVAEADSQGILSSIAEKLQERNKNCKILGVVSEVFSPDITWDFGIKKGCECSGYSQVEIFEQDACSMARMLIRDEGLLCGIRGGALLAAAINHIKENSENNNNEQNSSNCPIVVICVTDAYRWTNKDFLCDDWMLKKNYITEREVHQKYWWHGISLGNLRLKEPPSVKKNVTLEWVASFFMENLTTSRLLVIDVNEVDAEGNARNVEGTILGIVTRGLLAKLEEGKFPKELTLSQVPQSFCTEFGKISRNETLGALEKLVKQFPYVIVYSEIFTADTEDFGSVEAVQIPSGIATALEIVKWINEVEDHHRSNTEWKTSDSPLFDDYGQLH